MPEPNEATEQAEGQDRPTEDDERALEGLLGRLEALMRSPRACREYRLAYSGAHSALYFLFQARRLGRSPVRPGEFPDLSEPSAGPRA